MALTEVTETGPSSEPVSRPSRVGEIIAEKYKVIRLLGEGGMGAVYEAQHIVIQRRFAVKFVHTELARRADVITRFRREAQSAGGLENENIAAITDVGTAADGAPFIVMEYLTGGDLASVLSSHGPLPVPRAAHLVIQACRGLDAAHARGIVHRDLKPENLFVCKRGDGGDLVKVLDFGIAKLRDGDGAGAATQTGSAIGTPYYMPPEQARGAKDLDHRADIYALGVILYELLSCEKPHPGDGYNAILFHILTQKPEPLATLRPGLPEGLVAVVERAMSSDAADRFQTVMELAQALAPFVGRAITPHNATEDLPSTSSPRDPSATMATPVSLTEFPELDSLGTDGRSSVSRGSSMTVPSPDAGPARSPGKSKAPLMIVGALVAAIVAVALMFTLGGKRESNGSAPVPLGAPSQPSPSTTPQPSVSAAVSANASTDITPVVAGQPDASAPADSSAAKQPKDPKAVTTAVTKPKVPKPPKVDPYAP